MRRFYDWLGAALDTQAFYENPAMEDLIAHASFETARAVLECGCGTGRFAAHLFTNVLHRDYLYWAIDISPKLVRLAKQRLEPWQGRATVKLSSGRMILPFSDHRLDRFVATYVLDLLAFEDIRALLAEVRRVLISGGLISDGGADFSREVAQLRRSLSSRRTR